MRSKLLIGAIAIGMFSATPAIFAQTTSTPSDGSQPMPGETEDPASPNPMPDPSNPTPPMTEPLPPEMPMPAGEAQGVPMPMPMPAQPEGMDRSMARGSPATPPTLATDRAMSGSTSSAMMTPQPATKAYPPCSRTVQDSCRNPGEGPKATKRR